MNKVVENGHVAVIWSPGFGAGWSTWSEPENCFDPILVEWIRGGKVGPPPLDHYGEDSPYPGGLESAEIDWLPEGTRFEIGEYDGSESIRVLRESDFMVA